MMNKKILFFGIAAVLLLTTISLASALDTSSEQTVEKKESPLFGIRAKKAIGEKINDLKPEFLSDRLFFLPFQHMSKLKNSPIPSMQTPTCLANPCPKPAQLPDFNMDNPAVRQQLANKRTSHQELCKTSATPICMRFTNCVLMCYTHLAQ